MKIFFLSIATRERLNENVIKIPFFEFFLKKKLMTLFRMAAKVFDAKLKSVQRTEARFEETKLHPGKKWCSL